MRQTLSESGVVEALANQVCKRLTRKVIAALQKMTSDLLSGDDSGLESTWDEICVQVQFEQSFSWDAYDMTVRHLAEAQIAKLQRYEREAIWLQTSEGIDWSYED